MSRARVARLGLLFLTAVALAGCSIPSWVPLYGSNPLPPGSVATPAPKQATAPLIAVTPAAGAALDPASVLDRVICVINNDAITLFELDEAEAYYLYETKEVAPIGEARTALRDRLIQRIIENRLQLQQAEREKIAVEDHEIAEQMRNMKRMNAKNDASWSRRWPAGRHRESIKKRIPTRSWWIASGAAREPAGTVTAGDRPIVLENREKLEEGLTSKRATSSSFPTQPGEDGWEDALRRAPYVDRVLGAPISGSSPRSCRRTAPARTAARWARSSAASWRRRSRPPFSASRRARRRRRSARRSGTTSSAWIRRKRSRATGSPRRATRSATSCCGRSWRSACASGSPRFGSAHITCGWTRLRAARGR